MIKEINGKTVKVKLRKEKVKLPKNIQEKIENEWNNALEKTPELWNGDVVHVCSYKEKENEILIECEKTTYAHYLYDERVGLPEEYVCHNISAGYFVETNDGYYVVGELAESTSFPKCLQISGGGIDNADIYGSEISYQDTMRRELIEELNIDILDKTLVESNEILYLWKPEKAHAYSIFGKVKVNLTSEEMKKHYDEYLSYLRKNNLEIEFNRIILLKKENVENELGKYNNPKREYLENLFKLDKNK